MTTHSTIIGATMGATMGAIAALALMVGPAQANVGNPPSRAEVKRMIVQEAEATRVPPALALALAKVESDFQANALSSAGARGVMQIMPRTAIDEYGIDPESAVFCDDIARNLAPAAALGVTTVWVRGNSAWSPDEPTETEGYVDHVTDDLATWLGGVVADGCQD